MSDMLNMWRFSFKSKIFIAMHMIMNLMCNGNKHSRTWLIHFEWDPSLLVCGSLSFELELKLMLKMEPHFIDQQNWHLNWFWNDRSTYSTSNESLLRIIVIVQLSNCSDATGSIHLVYIEIPIATYWIGDLLKMTIVLHSCNRRLE